jgi:hypothetical protein
MSIRATNLYESGLETTFGNVEADVLAGKEPRLAREFLPRDPRLGLAELGNIPPRPPSVQRKEPLCPQGSVSPVAPAHSSLTTPTS